MNRAKAWLADPVKVLAAMNRTAAYACLFFATELRTWPLAVIGLLILIELRKVELP